MKMNPNNELDVPKNELDEVFAELRAEHREIQAPPGLEFLLRAEAAQRATANIPARQNRVWAWSLTAALLVLSLAGAVEWQAHRAKLVNQARTPVPQQTSAPKEVPKQDSLANKETAKLPPREHQANQASVRTSHRPAAAQQTEPREVSLADFIPLPASEGLPPALALSLVKMRIEQSSLQQYGLEVPAENTSRTLLAEFAVGEDGLPRAIRILP